MPSVNTDNNILVLIEDRHPPFVATQSLNLSHLGDMDSREMQSIYERLNLIAYTYVAMYDKKTYP